MKSGEGDDGERKKVEGWSSAGDGGDDVVEGNGGMCAGGTAKSGVLDGKCTNQKWNLWRHQLLL